MSVLCRLIVICLFLVSGVAFADTAPLDFRATVLDPPSTSFPTFPITANGFPVQFTACQPGELPGSNQAQGCFAGVNRSGTNWVGVDFAFANTSVLASQPVNCSPAPSDNIFGTANCSLDAQQNTYLLDFSSGIISNGQLFFLTETGVDPSLFPIGTGTFTPASSTVTPEPSSFVLLLTGLPSAGLVLRRLGKRVHRP